MYDTAQLGIGWWQHLDAAERILVGDYLYQCVGGIETNLDEARLHYLMWLHTNELQTKRNRYAVQENLQIKLPPSIKPDDDLTNRLESIHLAGFFRAIGSSLDCLGVTIYGVLGLQKELRIAYFKDADSRVLRIQDIQPPPVQLHLDFKNVYINAKNAAGPDGWLDWVVRYRNSLIHRGRPVWDARV